MKQDWKYQRLDEVGLIVTGSTPPTSNAENYSSHDRCFVKPSDIAKYEISIINDSEFYISNFAYENCCRKLPKGSVLFTCIGIVGKIGILDVDATCNQQINAILPSGKVTPKFLAYALLSQRNYIQAIANAPVVPIINKKQFSSFSIPVPTIDEQKKICSLLDKMNRVIEAKKEQLKELDNLAQAIFYDMFGDPTVNDKGWEKQKLGDCFSYIKNGANIKQDKSQIGFPITRIETLSNGVFNRDRMGYAGITDKTKYEQYILQDKDLLMSHINSKAYIGRTVLYRKKEGEVFIHGMNLLRLVPLPLLDSVFFCYLAKTDYVKEKIASIRKDAVNQSSFAISDLKKIDIPIPPLPLQQSFAEKVEAIERQKELINQSIKDVQTLFDAKMDYYFGD